MVKNGVRNHGSKNKEGLKGHCFDHKLVFLLVNSCKLIQCSQRHSISALFCVCKAERTLKRMQRRDLSQCEESKRRKAIVE